MAGHFSLNRHRLRISVSGSNEQGFVGVAAVATVRTPNGFDPFVLSLLRRLADDGNLPEDAVAALEQADAVRPATELGSYSIDWRYGVGGEILLEGWIENAEQRNLRILSADFASVCDLASGPLVTRSDVTAALNAIGETRAVSDRHGFLARLSRVGPFSSIFVFEHALDEVVAFGPLALPDATTQSKAIASVMSRISAAPQMPAEALERLLEVVIGPIANSLNAEHIGFGPECPQPKLSIIVVTSGSRIVLESLVRQQRHFPKDVEWIYATRRTSETATCEVELSALQERMKHPVILSFASSSATDVQMRNGAASLASGSQLLFLDEGCWIDDPAGFKAAQKAVEAGLADAVGIRTLLDDGSLDHDGLTMRAHPKFWEVFVCDPVGRGLPPTAKVKTSSAPGPTDTFVGSSAMLVSRAAYDTASGFDEAYRTSDFADAAFGRVLRTNGAIVTWMGQGRINRALRPVLPWEEAARLIDGCKAFRNFNRATNSVADVTAELGHRT